MKSNFLAIPLLVAVLGLAACAPAVQPGLEASPRVGAQSQPGQSEATVDIHCTDTDPHPLGQSIANTYGVTYEQVMTWFCSGFSFDNILVALETSEAVDMPADTLLKMLLEKDWEEIWAEVGFSGDK